MYSLYYGTDGSDRVAKNCHRITELSSKSTTGNRKKSRFSVKAQLNIQYRKTRMKNKEVYRVKKKISKWKQECGLGRMILNLFLVLEK